MSPGIEWLVVACGLGTFLLRLLPLWARLRLKSGLRSRGWWARLSRSIGPSAVAVLLTVSLWPMVALDPAGRPALAVAAGLAVVLLAKRLWGGIALPTLLGAAAYGLALHGLA